MTEELPMISYEKVKFVGESQFTTERKSITVKGQTLKEVEETFNRIKSQEK